MGRRGLTRVAVAGLLAAAVGIGVAPVPAGAVEVATGAELDAAWNDLTVTEITLTADVEVGCALRSRTTGSPPITLDGQGHTVTVSCDDAALGGTTQTLVAMTLTDVTYVGPTAEFAAALRAPTITLDGVRLVGRNEQSTIMHTSPGGDLVITGSDLETTEIGGLAVETRGRAVFTDTRITGAGSGIDAASTPAIEITDSTILVEGIALNAQAPLIMARSTIGGGLRTMSIQRGSTITDSTIVTGAGPDQNQQASIIVSGLADLLLDQVTVLPDPAVVEAKEPTFQVGVDGMLTLHATVLVAPPGQDLCGPFLGGVTGLGDNVATDDTCAVAEVLADPGLAAYDPDLGVAPPVADGPLVDAVADCTTTSDQLGLSRPQGPACDIGAVELDVAEPPPVTSVPAGPPPAAPPARPVVAPADFTG